MTAVPATPARARRINRRARNYIVATTLVCLWAAAGAPSALAGYWTDYGNAYNLGIQAYVYGQPLMDMEHVFATQTSVTVPEANGFAPVNQWSHSSGLNTSASLGITPNADTVNSTAWLDLTAQPIVLHVPDTGSRFNVVPLLTPYQEDIANIGSGFSGGLQPGDYLLAGPNWSGSPIPPGVTVVRSPYNRLWLIARTKVVDAADVANAVAIQAQEKLVPLSAWSTQGLSYTPPAANTLVTIPTYVPIPGTMFDNPINYFDALGSELAKFPPPTADAPLLAQLASVGIGPGMDPGHNPSLSSGTIAGLDAAVLAGPSVVHQDLLNLTAGAMTLDNGWDVLGVGQYGTNYTTRAVVDKYGLGAVTPNVAIYPFALSDRTGAALNATSTRYVVHYPAGDFPVPVQGFWSLTMYQSDGSFYGNPLSRYALGDRSNLHYNADGSLDIYIQNAEPKTLAEQDNWLPAPAGPFMLISRLYGPDAADISGILAGGPASPWPMPTILPCLSTGYTAPYPTAGIAQGIACAS